MYFHPAIQLFLTIFGRVGNGLEIAPLPLDYSLFLCYLSNVPYGSKREAHAIQDTPFTLEGSKTSSALYED